MLKIIAAIADNRVIGQDGELPWRLPDDMKWFKNVTGQAPVTMGTKTFWSLPERFRPLPDRENILLSRSSRPDLEEMGCTVVNDWDEVVHRSQSEDIFVIGGAEIYALALPDTDEMYITRVHADPNGNVFFPHWNSNEWELVSSKSHIADDRHQHSFTWEVWKRK